MSSRYGCDSPGKAVGPLLNACMKSIVNTCQTTNDLAAVIRRRTEAILSFHAGIKQNGPDIFRWYPERGGVLTVVTEADVFCPKVGEGSFLLAACIDKSRVSRFLDMGTGSGFHALLAANRAAEVIAVDIEDAACSCALRNAVRNGLADEIDVREGNLFDPIGRDEKFDLITFNPPFLEGVPRSPLERALFDPHYETLARFFSSAHRYLREGGRILVAFSSAGDEQHFLKLARALTHRPTKILSARKWGLDFAVYDVSPRGWGIVHDASAPMVAIDLSSDGLNESCAHALCFDNQV